MYFGASIFMDPRLRGDDELGKHHSCQNPYSISTTYP